MKDINQLWGDTDERCVLLAHFITEHKTTVRMTAAVFGISKSTVHKDLTEKLPRSHPVLFGEVKQLLDKNKAERHLRGGEATRKKYLAQKDADPAEETRSLPTENEDFRGGREV